MKSRMPKYHLNEIKIEVTHDCRLKCLHCSSFAGQDTGRSLEWESCEKIIDDAKAMGVRELAFSGGEPLIWDHIAEATKLASGHDIEVFLYTSGYAPNARRIIKSLRNFGLSKAMFSIFGENAEQHESITKVRGSYRQTIEIASYGVSLGLDTEFHFVPFSSNYKSLRRVAEQAREMGIKRVSVLRLVPQGRGRNISGLQLDHLENMELRRMIENLRKAGHDIRLGSPYNFIMLREKPQCKSGIDRLIVGPDLKIFPCDAFKHISPEQIGVNSTFSSLRNNNLSECWEKSPYLNTVRKHLNGNFANTCKECHKFDLCLSGCLAQKFYHYGELKNCPDPMCLLNN